MAKTLYIVRHAKAQWPEQGQSDFDRKLNARGHHDAAIMGSWFKNIYGCPEHWISSSAPRAFATAEHFANAMDNTLVIHPEILIYEAPWQQLLNVLKETPNSANRVILFGHNPGVSYLVAALTKQSVEFATSTVACLESNIEQWNELKVGSCSLINISRP